MHYLAFEQLYQISIIITPSTKAVITVILEAVMNCVAVSILSSFLQGDSKLAE